MDGSSLVDGFRCALTLDSWLGSSRGSSIAFRVQWRLHHWLARLEGHQLACRVPLFAKRIFGVLDPDAAAVRALEDGPLLLLVHHHRRGDIRKLHKTRRATVIAHHLQLTEPRHVAENGAELRLAGVVAEVSNEKGVAGRVVLRVGHLLVAARLGTGRGRISTVTGIVLLVAGCGGGELTRPLRGSALCILKVHVLVRHLRAQHRRLIKTEVLHGVLGSAGGGSVGEQRKALRLVALPVHLAGFVPGEEAKKVIQLTLLHVGREA
mmetsp:Transcript_27831/g.49720  ORF Transcript_27831/g.49720 Transcript_27831/m.49720 type:complete len:265 (+) Transcript_27831:699-1493(+)